jgi:hypothetical protein
MGKVSLAEQKLAIIRLLDAQSDPGLLREIYALLKPEQDTLLQEKLTARALKANEDIIAGRTYTPKEARKELDELFSK